MRITRLSVTIALLAVLTAQLGVFPANPTFAQRGMESIGCRQLYQSYTRCYETGKATAYDVCVAAAHQSSEEFLARSGQSLPLVLAVRALEITCLLGCEAAKADTFLAYQEFERVICP
jgi:hypothetical protein